MLALSSWPTRDFRVVVVEVLRSRGSFEKLPRAAVTSLALDVQGSSGCFDGWRTIQTQAPATRLVFGSKTLSGTQT